LSNNIRDREQGTTASGVSFSLEYREELEDLSPARVEPDERLHFGRFTFLRKVEDRLVLESALSNIIVSTNSADTAEVVALLALGASGSSLARRLPTVSVKQMLEFLGILVAARLLCREGEQESAALMFWEFHDLLFHRMTRVIKKDREFATFRFRGKQEPLPPFKPPISSDAITLPAPDLSELAKTDWPFSAVLEARRSKRVGGAIAVSLDQLAEFLYRTSHVQDIRTNDEMKRMFRPYPSGGGVHELEFYVVANRCLSLESGIYHYRVDDHVLQMVSSSDAAVRRVVERCAFAADLKQQFPDVVIVLTARFPRLFFKYESIAYRVILMHVGVVMQTMYLIATAMNLAPCAIGSGWLRWLEAEEELSWLKEAAVGEFMLSGAPDQ
jgi:SagB-type dehydrogenase family enzyme